MYCNYEYVCSELLTTSFVLHFCIREAIVQILLLSRLSAFETSTKLSTSYAQGRISSKNAHSHVLGEEHFLGVKIFRVQFFSKTYLNKNIFKIDYNMIKILLFLSSYALMSTIIKIDENTLKEK